jgi:aminoglycoside/choline kinase family phosphotransferase
MRNRQSEITDFLNDTTWADATGAPLNQDASFRQYTRLTLGKQSAMLMDALPPEKPVAEFDRIAKHLASLGVRAPQSLKLDNENGLMLLEDFGDITFTQALKRGDSESALYAMATDLLTQLHNQPTAASISLPAYDLDVLQQEAALLLEWFYPYVMQSTPSAQISQNYQNAWQEVFKNLDDLPSTIVLRDYHIDNLMVVEQGGTTQCAVLDFQDALLGHPAYDLVSLLQDARRDISGALIEEMLSRYFSANSGYRAAFMPWYHALGAQRHCKVLGIFVRLFERDAKGVYLQHLPRVIRLLAQCLAQSNLKPVRTWFEQHLNLDNLNLPPNS